MNSEHEVSLDNLSNFRYNRLDGVDADLMIDGELVPTTLDDAQVKMLSDVEILEFDQIKYQELINASQKKSQGISFKGVNISLNESNQNGLAAVRAALEMAEKIGIDAFPLNFNAETADNDKPIKIDDIDEFNSLFVEFFIARQQFFK